MTKTDLHEMVASGENSGVEFTRHVTDDHALAKHLIAFANLHGGRVLLGVDDDGSIRGLSRRDPPARDDGDDTGRRTYRGLEEWVAQACRDKIRPEIVPRFEIVTDVTPGRGVAVVQVDRGWTAGGPCTTCGTGSIAPAAYASAA